MSTAEERQEILELVAGGKLSAAEAAAMLASPSNDAANVESLKAEERNTIEVEELSVSKAGETSGKKATWLHVRVSDLKTGKRKVTVNIPLRLMKLGMKLGGAFSPELQELDVDELGRMLQTDAEGILVDVEDEEDGNHVQVYVD